MRTARNIAMAAVVATIPACGGTAPCDAEFGPWGDELPDLDMLVGDTTRRRSPSRFRGAFSRPPPSTWRTPCA
ncbi:MAG: hypothetical protein OXQ94_15055 [Gemmatimonadota bacterium]|nr:hypothetical protein [Gemmatimonadota bacterium]MDE2872995.1 hypothetical protein [Gemmatimonadota bacterium]